MQINTRPHTPLEAISIATITHPDTNTHAHTHKRRNKQGGALKSRALGEKTKQRDTHGPGRSIHRHGSKATALLIMNGDYSFPWAVPAPV